MNKWVIVTIIVLIALTFYFMTEKSFDAVITFIIKKNEGGYVSPERAREIGDSGGETKYGISKKSYPALDIKNLTIGQAVQIYKDDYLGPVLNKVGEVTNMNLLYQILDMAINAGPAVALSLYKPGMSVQQYKDARLAKYQTFKGWSNPDFRTSWTNRTKRNFI